MSWSDDTRCLYCEGRLPLYRKITHGQFCSSAHRKSYWQEHERLAVERLHQTHSSLRSYRSVVHEEAPREPLQEPTPYLSPEHPSVASLALPEMDLEIDPAAAFDVNLYPLPEMSDPPAAASELLGLLAPDFLASTGSSPELVAADPFEYEITIESLPPSHSSGLEASSLPEGLPVAVWSHPGLRPSAIKKAAGVASMECEVELRHPESQTPAAEMCAADRVELPPVPVLESRRRMEPSLRVLDMEPDAVTSVALDVSLQSDVLVELLDQQIPHPDQLHALDQFAAHRASEALACQAPEPLESAVAHTTLPAAAISVTAPDYRLSVPEMLPVSSGLQAAPGSLISRTAISEVAGIPPAAIAAVMPVVESAHQMGMAGLQVLHSSLSQPIHGVFALQIRDSMALDLSTGVSSDVTYPSLNPAPPATTMAPVFTRILPLTFNKKRKPVKAALRPESLSRVLPQAVETHPVFPQSRLQPLDRKPVEDAFPASGSDAGSRLPGEGLRKLEPAWAHATGFWQHAPRDLKLLLFAIPALLALFFHPGLPRIAFAAPKASPGFTGSVQRALNTEWVNVRQTLENRAAVALDEDFRSGLDNWASPGGSTTEWSFDATGFVRPGPLALYRPSVGLSDYQVQFLGLIDKKALSWVVRAADFDNFYVVKLAQVKTGPMAAVGLTRYAVINGKAQDRHDETIPLMVQADTLYRVRMDVKGSDFTVEVQGQMADSWTETRLPRGGIGFFTASGEASRLRWVQITHQYDMLGRLCAYLAPFDTTNGSWQP